MSDDQQTDRIAALVDALNTSAKLGSYARVEANGDLGHEVVKYRQGNRAYEARIAELEEMFREEAEHAYVVERRLKAELSQTHIRGLTIIQGLREELAAAKASVPTVPAKPDRSAEFATNQALKRTTPIWIVKDSDPKRDGCVRICYSGAETIEGPADPMCGGCYEAGQAYTAMRAEPGYDPNLSQYKMRSLMLARGCACRSQYLSGRRNEAVPRPNDAQPADRPDDGGGA